MKVKFVNLTPHDINIVTDNGIVTIPRSGKVARCNTISSLGGRIDGIPLYATRYGDVIDLPPMTQEKILYIVSAMVKQKEYTRNDLVSPGELVRDEKGNVIGCKGLII
jgi:hypothetical protein